jgi:hypothetical protein
MVKLGVMFADSLWPCPLLRERNVSDVERFYDVYKHTGDGGSLRFGGPVVLASDYDALVAQRAQDIRESDTYHELLADRDRLRAAAKAVDDIVRVTADHTAWFKALADLHYALFPGERAADQLAASPGVSEMAALTAAPQPCTYAINGQHWFLPSPVKRGLYCQYCGKGQPDMGATDQTAEGQK